MGKLTMLTRAVRARGGLVEKAGLLHYRAKQVKVVADPKMSVLADGVPSGQGSLAVQVHPRALTVLAGLELTGDRATKRVTNTLRVHDEK
jgi:diacylglycerol kinase family enzyme